ARSGAALACDVGGHRLCHLEPVRIDVVERDLGVEELGELEDVGEQVLRELDAAGAYERDARQPLFAPSVRPLMNCFCRRAKTTRVGTATRSAAAAIRFVFVK